MQQASREAASGLGLQVGSAEELEVADASDSGESDDGMDEELEELDEGQTFSAAQVRELLAKRNREAKARSRRSSGVRRSAFSKT